jgi:hypothetical protein
MGYFAVNVAIAYQIGVARGDHSILSAMDIGDSELFAAFGQSIDDLILVIARIWKQSEKPGLSS